MTPPLQGPGVLAPQSGGCARHVLSRRVTYHFQDDQIEILFDDTDTNQLQLLLASTVTLQIETPDGEWTYTGQIQDLLLKPKRAYFTPINGERRPIGTEK